jgi:hypothetical protein
VFVRQVTLPIACVSLAIGSEKKTAGESSQPFQQESSNIVVTNEAISAPPYRSSKSEFLSD